MGVKECKCDRLEGTEKVLGQSDICRVPFFLAHRSILPYFYEVLSLRHFLLMTYYTVVTLSFF